MFCKFHEARQRGFTLVELIIVLAIIGILSALAISRISYNRRRAAMTTCNGIMGDIKKAAEAYYADTGIKLGDGANATTGVDVTTGCALIPDYMSAEPRQPHGASVTGHYKVFFATGTEVAQVSCPSDRNVVFPDGHKF